MIDVGEDIEYVLTITNRLNTLDDVVITDDFPEDVLQLDTITTSPGLVCQNDANEIRCRMDRFPGDTTHTIIARFIAIASGTATNTATVVERQGQTANAASTVIINDVGQVLQITKAPNLGSVSIGQRVDFTVNIENLSPSLPITDLELVDDFPEDLLQIRDVTPGAGINCTRDALRISCNAPVINPGQTLTFSAAYDAIAGGNAQNAVSATAILGGAQKQANVTANVLISDPGNPLLIRKSPDQPVIALGEEVEYRIELNNGDQNIQLANIVVLDDYPQDVLEIISVNATPGLSCRFDADVIECAATVLPPGSQHLITARYRSIAPGTAQNTVQVTDSQGNTTSANANVIIEDPGNPFFLSKEADNSTVDLGEQVTYTVIVSNRSAALDLNNIDLVDDFPEDLLRVVSVNSPGTSCQQGAEDIRCTIDRLTPGETRTIVVNYESISSGTANNTVTVTDDADYTDTESSAVIVEDPGNPFLVSKSPSVINPEVGETVQFDIDIANRTNAFTLSDINIVDDYPEDTLELQGITTSQGMVCDQSAQEISCHIETIDPQDSYQLTTIYDAIAPGVATNSLTVSDANGESGTVTSSINIQEPEPTSIELSSSCENRSILIGEQCQLTVIAHYEFQDSQNITADTEFFNFQNIGTIEGGVFTAVEAGRSSVTATFDSVTSNAITLHVIDDIGVGLDPDGNMITHFPARASGGAPDSISFTDPVAIGAQEAGANTVARHNRLVLNGLGGDGQYNWVLEDATMGTLLDFDSGIPCPETNNRIQCTDAGRVIFESSNTEGTVVIRLNDAGEESLLLTMHIIEPAIEEITIRDEQGVALNTIPDIPRQQMVRLTAEKRLADGSTDANAEDELEWEFRFNGGDWTNSSEDGNIARGVLQPIRTGTFAVRARASQQIAQPGAMGLTETTQEIVSDEVTVIVGDAVPFIESMRLAGNEGMAKGTSDTLYVRMRHVDTLSQIGDMELDLVKGRFTTAESIPVGVQHFFIELVEEDIFKQAGGDRTALLEIPFFVPLLDDIKTGTHTLRLYVNNVNGNAGRDSVVGVLPVYIGEPVAGDANLDGEVDLIDAVYAMRFVSGTSEPSPLQAIAVDYDGISGVTLRDFLEGFYQVLRSFLQ